MSAAAKHHVAPTIRGAFLKALDIIAADEGLTHSELMAREIREHGLLAVMDKVAKFREHVGTNNINLTATHDHSGLPATAEFLAEAVRKGQVSSSEVAGEERSILPH